MCSLDAWVFNVWYMCLSRLFYCFTSCLHGHRDYLLVAWERHVTASLSVCDRRVSCHDWNLQVIAN
jgi:hypothetical protein